MINYGSGKYVQRMFTELTSACRLVLSPSVQWECKHTHTHTHTHTCARPPTTPWLFMSDLLHRLDELPQSKVSMQTLIHNLLPIIIRNCQRCSLCCVKWWKTRAQIEHRLNTGFSKCSLDPLAWGPLSPRASGSKLYKNLGLFWTER